MVAQELGRVKRRSPATARCVTGHRATRSSLAAWRCEGACGGLLQAHFGQQRGPVYNGARMDNPWLLVGFLSIFHVIGASVLANALRELWGGIREKDPRGCRGAFLMVWASIFGCIPFTFGIAYAGSEVGTPMVLVGQVAVWMGTFLTVLLARDAVRQLAEPFLHRETMLMLFGGGLIVGGVAVAAFLRGEGQLAGLMTGVTSVVIGSGVFGYGLWKLFKSTE